MIAQELRNGLLGEAARSHPDECCGILLGTGSRIAAIVPVRNVHSEPHRHFEIDPQALVDAHRNARSGGPQVVGYFHSHPNGLAEPSPTDRAQSARDGRIWAIVADGGVTFWRDGEAGFEPLSYSLCDP